MTAFYNIFDNETKTNIARAWWKEKIVIVCICLWPLNLIFSHKSKSDTYILAKSFLHLHSLFVA